MIMMSSAAPRASFDSDRFYIDAGDERLFGPSGPVRLGNKAFQLLLRLAGRAGRLVTKDELMSSVWDGTTVTEFCLTSAVKELRRALGDDARAPRFIESVYGRGYRLLTAIDIVDAAPPARFGSTVSAPVAARVDCWLVDGPEPNSVPPTAQMSVCEDRPRPESSRARPWKRMVRLVVGLASLGPALAIADSSGPGHSSSHQVACCASPLLEAATDRDSLILVA